MAGPAATVTSGPISQPSSSSAVGIGVGVAVAAIVVLAVAIVVVVVVVMVMVQKKKGEAFDSVWSLISSLPTGSSGVCHDE